MVVAILKVPEPVQVVVVPVTSPVKDTVLAPLNALAVAELPVQEPELPVVFWLSVATRAAATVPLVMLEPLSDDKAAPLPENVGAATFSVDVTSVVLTVSLFVPPVVNPIWSVPACHIPVFKSDVHVKDGVVIVSASIPWKPPLVADVALNVSAAIVPTTVAPVVDIVIWLVPAVVKPILSAPACHMPVFKSDVK